MLLVPPPFIKSASGITMTAGTTSGLVGYANNYGGAFTFGSITAEPAAGQTLKVLYSQGTNSGVVFDGSIVSLMATWTLYVDGTGYSLAGAAYDSGSAITFVNWSGGTGPIFVDGNTYTIRIE